tara:strand:- start:3936 stop:4580 length:645 start_codon:yes stop_codon:yes gene_type:complete
MGKNTSFILLMSSTLIFILLVTMFINLIFPSDDIDALNSIRQPNIEFTNLELGTNPNAEINFIEFGDFTCAHCAEFSGEIKQLLELFPNEINFIFKHYPSNENKDSPRAALASECARNQGKFTEYHDILFERPLDFSLGTLILFADELQLNIEQFNECMQNFTTLPKIDNDIKDATFNGVRGTPTIFINERKIEGLQPLPTLRLLIEQELTRVK